MRTVLIALTLTFSALAADPSNAHPCTCSPSNLTPRIPLPSTLESDYKIQIRYPREYQFAGVVDERQVHRHLFSQNANTV